MTHKSIFSGLIVLVMIVCFSCDKQNDAESVPPRVFNANIDGIAIHPITHIDSHSAEQINRNKQAILEGQSIVPAIDENYTPPATVTAARPTSSSAPPQIPGGPSRQISQSSPAVTNTYDFDPNSY